MHAVEKIKLPGMKLAKQTFVLPPAVDPQTQIEEGWAGIASKFSMRPGAQIAVAVGSRGISNLSVIVRTVVRRLRESGYEPFIVPAMGSHGGAAAQGQIEVLEARCITEKTVEAPIRATMDVRVLGEEDGIQLYFDQLASGADAIFVVNRIKPHTNFIGATESGLLKMLAIGLGNQKGAEQCHRLTMIHDYYTIIRTAGCGILNRCPPVFGVGILENQLHETCQVFLCTAEELEAVEADALKKARDMLPKLPLDNIDLLIVDEMGKDISGEGIDPCVVGRDVCACGVRRDSPAITRIFVRDLTEASEGSALGVGQADFTTKRLVEKIDFQATAVNCLTCCCPESGRVPLTYETDELALAAALQTLRPHGLDDLRLVHIKNTLELDNLQVSQGCWQELEGLESVTLESKPREFDFDKSGNIVSPWS